VTCEARTTIWFRDISLIPFKKVKTTRFGIFKQKIAEVTIFKNQYFLNNKNHLLVVLKEEASDSLLPVYQV
jgi:hypothetical protein